LPLLSKIRKFNYKIFAFNDLKTIIRISYPELRLNIIFKGKQEYKNVNNQSLEDICKMHNVFDDWLA